ncbi:MAG: ChaN family lipoprotein [Lautropia sp.]|nr:ChaN family lipoprotein [Lautropia sp.]
MGRFGFLWLITGLLSACAHGPAHRQTETSAPVANTVSVTSELIFDTKSGESLSEDALKRRFIETPWLLWGEQHDQARHHVLRARWLRHWAEALPVAQPSAGLARHRAASADPIALGRRMQAAIVFEHLDREHGAALRQVQARQPRGPLVDWLAAARFDAKRWGEAVYQPLFEAARHSGVYWVAGNLSREAARRWMIMPGTPGTKSTTGTAAAGGTAGTEAWLKPRLAAHSAQPADADWLATLRAADWNQQAEAHLLAAVRVGHCDALPESMLVPMAAAQRLRDAALAAGLKQAAGSAGPMQPASLARRLANDRAGLAAQHQGDDDALPPRLLLAGNGHVDKRFGVPRYLGVAEAQVLVMGMETVSAQAFTPMVTPSLSSSQQQHRSPRLSDWVGPARASRMAAAYDVVVLTPVSPEAVPDHCAVFRDGKSQAGKSPAAMRQAGSQPPR